MSVLLMSLITPVRAKNTDLVPTYWTVEIDRLEGEVDLANLDYSSCPVQNGETCINGDTMLERSAASDVCGSLGFAAALFMAQKNGKDIFPVESRGKHDFLMPRTVLIDDTRRRRMARFGWSGKRWGFSFCWLGYGFLPNTRFVRPAR